MRLVMFSLCVSGFSLARQNREPLVITDFTASWCKPCQKMTPVFEGLAKEYKGSAVFCKVDINDLPDVYDGLSIPAFHVRQLW